MMTQHRHLYTKYRNEWERNSYHRNVKLDAVGSIVPRFDDKQSSRHSPAAVCLFPLKFQFHSTFIFVFVFVSIVVWSASRGGRKSRVNVYAFSWKISQHAWSVAWITDYLQKHKRAKNNRFSGRWIKERGEGIEWLRLLKRFDPVELCWDATTASQQPAIIKTVECCFLTANAYLVSNCWFLLKKNEMTFMRFDPLTN